MRLHSMSVRLALCGLLAATTWVSGASAQGSSSGAVAAGVKAPPGAARGGTAHAGTPRMTPTCFVVKFKVKPGKDAAFEQAFRVMQAGVREHEPGNLYYDLYMVDQDRQTYVIVEHYKDAAAVREHGRTAHARQLMAALRGLLDGPPDALRLDLVSSKD